MVHKIEITIKKGMYVKMVSIAQGSNSHNSLTHIKYFV